MFPQVRPRAGVLQRSAKIIAVLLFLYLFLVSISLMSHAFKGFGRGFAESLIRTTSNPFIGLFVGLLATSIVQSSSTTTSMVVAFVASGVLTVPNAIPIVMGANIGTTVTNTMVAIGHVTRREEFKRALSCSTMHDFFNILTVIVLLPLEITTHFLEKASGALAEMFCDVSGFAFQSPLKTVINPAITAIDAFYTELCGFSGTCASGIMLVTAFIVLFSSLFYIVKVMRSLIARQAEMVLDKMLGRNAFVVMILGMLFTAIVQSSSVTTSIMVPLVASNILSLEAAFPVTLGANIGTTITAMLAALTGNVAGITIAFAHLLFNITGIVIFYPFKSIRRIPLTISRFIGDLAYRKRRYAFIYVTVLFFLLPGLLIFLSRRITW